MKENEDIETMYSRFQTLVSDLQVLSKSYTVPDHFKKILRSLRARFRPKVTTIQEAKDLNKLSLENLVSSFKSLKIESVEDELDKKSKSIALTSKGKSAKALQATESEEETPYGGFNNDSRAEDMTYFTERFHYLTKKKRFPDRSSGSKGSSFKSKKEYQKVCFNSKKLGHFIDVCPEL
jgi:hypothetical protein